MADAEVANVIPNAALFTGAKMPMVGLGTWKSKAGKVETAVYHALKSGYRHIDCAAVYGNEKEVGAGMKQAFDEGICKREDIFVTSKLWSSFHRADLVKPALQKTLDDLGLEYLDLYLIHWPTNFKAGDAMFPKNERGEMLHGPPEENFMQTWPELEKCVDDQKTRAIGLSNFNSQQIERVRKKARIMPAVLQVECHPYCTQVNLLKYCNDNNMVMTAYSPLGSPDRPWASANDPVLLEDENVAKIAAKNKKTSAQVLIRFAVERGIVVIPKSVTPSRIEQNLQVGDFKLSDEDVQTILNFNRNWHSCVPRVTVDGKPTARDAAHPEFPFGVDEEYIM